MGPFLSHIPPFFVLENRREDIISMCLCKLPNCHNTHGSEQLPLFSLNTASCVPLDSLRWLFQEVGPLYVL